jgi:hypothetical protein
MKGQIDALRLFVSAIQGEAVEAMNKVVERLSAVCDATVFASFSQGAGSSK